MHGYYLPPETEWAHSIWRSNFRQLGLFMVIFSFSIIFIAILSSFERITIPKDNFPNASRAAYLDQKIREHSEFFIGDDGRNQTFLWDLHLRNKIKHKQGLVRVYFGTTWAAWCFPGIPSSHSTFLLPSILRTIELKAMSQVLLRFLALSTMCTRSLGAWFRACKFRVLNPSYPKLLLYSTFITPILLFIEVSFAFLVTALHQDCDEDFKWLLPWALISLGISSCLYILTYILMDILDKTNHCLHTIRFPIRIICLSVQIFSFPRIVLNFMPFLERKLCHPYVPWTEAVLEYIAFVVVVLFNITCIFDFPRMEFAITVMGDELEQMINPIDEGVYKAAYSVKRQGTVKRKTHETTKL